MSDDNSGFFATAAEAVTALVRAADALDRAVFLLEAIAAQAGLVAHEDVGLEPPEEEP